MINFELTLEYDAETVSAIESRRGELTQIDFLKKIIDAECARFVETDFNAASQRLIEAAKTLPFEERAALIAEVEQKIQAIA